MECIMLAKNENYTLYTRTILTTKHINIKNNDKTKKLTKNSTEIEI